MGTVSRIKDGENNEIHISMKMQNRLVEMGQSWMARAEKVDGFVLEKVGFSHQGTDRITSHQDWRDILAPALRGKNDIRRNSWYRANVSIYGHSKELQLPTPLAKTWILNESFGNKWHKVNTQEEASLRWWVYLEEEPVWGNKVLSPEITAFLDERQRNNKSLSLSLEELSSLNGNHFITFGVRSGFTQHFKGMSAHA